MNKNGRQIKAVKIHSNDNVGVALVDLQKGDSIEDPDLSIILSENIPAKHKFSLDELKQGADIIMYGVLVGRTVRPISKGSLISTQNVQHATGTWQGKQRDTDWLKPNVSRWQDRQFMGYHRADGSVGTANYWVVIPMVFCENKNVDVLQEAFVKALGYSPNRSPYEAMVEKMVTKYRSGETNDPEMTVEDQMELSSPKIFPNVDGIKFLKHTLGCGGTRQDARALCGLLAGYITHPNVAGATVLSLGCQNAQISVLQEEISKRDPQFSKPLFLLEQQSIGNEKKLLQQAITKTFEGLVTANKMERKPASLSRLCIGLECGGSDGFSGISANPAIGYTSDLVVALGGAVVLSEFPELCGVEQELSDRCVDEHTANRFLELMEIYQKRAQEVGSGFYANPSPGNIKDGLITDAMKSAGAAKKGGSSPVIDVLDYPEKITKSGLNLLCTPGSDIESTTAEVGAGANIVLFTTGLGTPTGNPVAPVIKIASNTALYNKMRDVTDINTGTIIEGTESIRDAGERILDYIIRVASGEEKTKATQLLHDDFIPWKRGISL